MHKELSDVAERWLTFPLEQKLEMLANISHLRELVLKQHDLLGQMEKALVHQWMKETEDKFMEWNRETFMGLVRAYHKAIQTDQQQFTYRGHEFLVAYAKYLIEYLEKSFGETLAPHIGWERAKHAKAMKEKNEPKDL